MNHSNQPLADRIRPEGLDGFIGQEHLVGNEGIIRKSIESGTIPSFIMWGPPGVGKTTLARVIAHLTDRVFYTLSAVHSGVKDVRNTIDKARKQQFFNLPNPVLFIDEIHRFSKSQQDSLLDAVEKGIITLIGATTENPSFEVISPLLSRCQVYVLKPFDKELLLKMIDRALIHDPIFKRMDIKIIEYEALLHYSGGDARKLLNALELAINNESAGEKKEIILNNQKVKEILQNNMAIYDKQGEQHYDIISAFIKSIRGSDPNAAVYWLARMIEGGEDPKFIARRLIILASEDIGLANPNALLLANNCFQAINVIGMPEGRIVLSETAIYLACSPKSNASYMAINKAQKLVNETGDLPVPLHIRNAPTKLMKDLGYSKDYKYAHDFKGNFIKDNFLPEKIQKTTIYYPRSNAKEDEFKNRLNTWWKDWYDY